MDNDDLNLLSTGMDQPWCMRECVRKLIDAADILLHRKSYDGHGHEEIAEAARFAQQYLNAAPNAQGAAGQWEFCPECGSYEIRYEEGNHKQCEQCHQEWYTDIDYSETVAGNLNRLFSAFHPLTTKE